VALAYTFYLVNRLPSISLTGCLRLR